jgi:DNA-directed RNA polymerase specialized sigma24 family protein
MDDPGSVSVWLGQLKAGDRDALKPLWERYFAQLVGLVRTRLRAGSTPVADEEDVALSAFDSFYRGIGNGRFPRLEDRDDLWQVLLLLTRQKAVNLARHEGRQKRGGGKIRHLSGPADGDSSSMADVFGELLGSEPAPDFAAEVAEECRRLLDSLNDDRLREMAICKMEGYSNEEIAARTKCSLATVERKLKLIRSLWSEEIA